MKKYILSPRAQEDLKIIKTYTLKRWGVTQVNLYLSLLRDKIRMLADNPCLGVNRDEVKKGYCSFPAGSHSIFFRVANSGIEVLGIPHQSMDVLNYFEQNLN